MAAPTGIGVGRGSESGGYSVGGRGGGAIVGRIHGWLLAGLLTRSGWVCEGSFWIVGTKIVKKLVATLVGWIVVRTGSAKTMIGCTACQTADVTDGKVADEILSIMNEGSWVKETIRFGDRGWNGTRWE